MATNHKTHLASWALRSRAWYPDATAAHLAQGIFLLMNGRNMRIIDIGVVVGQAHVVPYGDGQWLVNH